MAYRFKLDEPLEKGFRRIARNQVELALANIASDEVSPKNIHECRKSLKRTRALIKLVSPSIGMKAATRLDRNIRDVARALSLNRDGTVVMATIANLAHGADEPLAAALKQLQAKLEVGLVTEKSSSHNSLPIDEFGIDDIRIEEIRADLDHIKHYLENLTIAQRGISALKPGLFASYKDGKRLLKVAYKRRTAESFHDLRKAVQVHWRQMSLLSRAWPEEMHLRVAAAREISQILGEEHDLELVDQASQALDGVDENARSLVRSVCKERRRGLRQRARFRAERLFAEDASSFAKRIVASWRAARKIEAQSIEAQALADAPPVDSSDNPAPAATTLSAPHILAKPPRQALARKAG